MSPNASHSDMTPPLPPVVKGLVLVFSVFMTLVLMAFIGFIAVEFVADMAGHPLFLVAPNPTEGDALPPSHDMESEIKSPFELIAPKHQTQLRGPEVVAIYTVRTMPSVRTMPPATPNLLINGIPHPWEMQYGDNTWFARLRLPAGMHQLRAGEAEAEFFVVAPGSSQFAQEPWLLNRPHVDTNEVDRCFQCHDMPEDSLFMPMPGRDAAIGDWRGVRSCFVCHDEDAHAIAHRSVLPLADRHLQCVRCHTIH